MKKILLFCFLLSASLTFVACGDEENQYRLPGTGGNGGGSTSTDATNKNANTGSNAVAKALEVPHLKGGSNNLFITHSTSDYGVTYSLEFDCSKRAQRWTCFQMVAKNSVKNWSRSNWNNVAPWFGDPFQEDPDIPSQYNVTAADHYNDGFDRGHICASEDRVYSQEANLHTFYLSNMHPQYNAFNAGIWEKMESYLRDYWNKDAFRDTLFVCKGGTIDKSDQILMYNKTGLIVPRYFFMALLCKKGNTYKALGFWAEHKNENRQKDNLSLYVVPVRYIEEQTGLDFFCNLPDDVEEQVETATTESIVSLWNVK